MKKITNFLLILFSFLYPTLMILIACLKISIILIVIFEILLFVIFLVLFVVLYIFDNYHNIIGPTYRLYYSCSEAHMNNFKEVFYLEWRKLRIIIEWNPIRKFHRPTLHQYKFIMNLYWKNKPVYRKRIKLSEYEKDILNHDL